MSSPLPFQCVNCGATLEAPARGGSTVDCPVCRYSNDSGSPQALTFTRDTLEHSLGALIAQARAGGVTGEEIVGALRDELEFAAELAHFGRQICVQIIDLGPQEGQPARPPDRDRASMLRSRAVEG